MKTLFSSERELCDHVFAESKTVRQTCFAEIAKEATVDLFVFSESITGRCKKSLERIFPILDKCDALSELMPDIESIFSYESTSAVRSQVAATFSKASDVARHMIRDFEMAMQKDASRTPAMGGGIHPLTRNAMNCICSLVQYSRTLAEIYTNQPLPEQSPFKEMLPGSSFAEHTPSSIVTVHFTWLVLVLFCKLDRKAELYKDVGLSCVFLANNLQYIIAKTSTSSLQYILSYPEVGRRFNQAFSTVLRAQAEWVVLNRNEGRHQSVSEEEDGGRVLGVLVEVTWGGSVREHE